jgi:O-antigen/teichoic acid export membrane protein
VIKWTKFIDTFFKNIIIVFIGTSIVNLLNLLYQLLIAHKLTPSDFSAFNSLLSLYTVLSSPLITLQLAVAKSSAEFYVQAKISELKFLISDLFKKTFIFAILTLFIFGLMAARIVNLLKIPSLFCGYILATLLALSWLGPVLLGGIQGLELFSWLSFIQVFGGIIKLILAFMFILLGHKIAGALGALLISTIVIISVSYLPLRQFITKIAPKDKLSPLRDTANPTNQIIVSNGVKYKEIIRFLFPVSISTFCFITLVSFDMVLVKYFFNIEEAGVYSLAQVVGKVFLFLPGAISIVMFPKTSGLNAKKMDTLSTLKRSLSYAIGLCIFAGLLYNLRPHLILKIFTGKVLPESIFLGRLFSLSMSFFALTFILNSYFLSVKDMRFIRYLVLACLLQNLAIFLFHKSLLQVQLILCINSILLFFTNLFLVYEGCSKCLLHR